MKKGLIIGKGWLGSRLEFYLEKNYTISTTKRNSDADNCYSIDFDNYNSQKLTENYDFIIVTIPFGRRNSIEELNLRFNHLIEYLGDYKNQLILLSSTAIYPEINDEITEESISIKNLINPYYFIENQLKVKYNQLVILRLGGLMGDDRYLSKYLNLDSQNLNQMVNHIHYLDVINLIQKIIISTKNNEIYNIIAPEHPTKREVLEFQLKGKINQPKSKVGKVILSTKIQKEFDYEFLFPNPIYFNKKD